MTYTINQAVDVNAQVDIGDLNIQGHTISNSQNGTIVITTGSESHLDITYGAHISNLVLSGNDVGTKSSNANLTFTPHGSGIVKSNAAFEVGNINLEDNTISSTNTNGNILLSPNGTGTVRTDNLQFDGNTISSTNTDGDIVLSPNGSGNVGIGTSSPGTKLHVDGALYLTSNPSNPGNTISASFWNQANVGPTISGLQFVVQTNGTTERLRINNEGNVGIGTTNPQGKLHISSGTDGDCVLILQADTDNNNENDNPRIEFRQDGNYITSTITNEDNVLALTNATAVNGGIKFKTLNTAANDHGNTIERMRITPDGNVGIGTTSPYAKLHVNGTGDSGTSLASASRKYFIGTQSGTSLVGDTSISNFGTISIYANQEIVTSSWFISHGSSTYSDARIKKNIVDINDASALETIRAIKPKKYDYKDNLTAGSQTVWGFIAQEVAETLDYAVTIMEKAIPNVYKLASVSDDGTVLTFEEPVTLETMDTIKLQLKTLVSEEHDVTISEVLSSTSIRLTEPLTEEHHTGTLGDESIVRKVFVYGQVISDFHVLKKEAIFTVAVAALQEVDRRQTTDNERILELEGDLSEAQETIATQAQDIVTLKAQVAALMQHTGVTI